MILPVQPIGQRNPIWRSLPLGFSSLRVGDAGCAISALAMLINATRLADPPLSPPEINAALRQHDAFTGPARAWVQWDRVPAIWPHLVYSYRLDAPDRPLKPAEINDVLSHLQQRVPVIAYVDARQREPGLQQHYILVIGHDPDDRNFIINDPWTGRTDRLCPRYGVTPARAICGLVVFDHAPSSARGDDAP